MNRQGRSRAALATKHGKESLFGPSFSAIGWEVVVAPVDTDRFGTFGGEVERPGPPREIVERKARAAAEVSGLAVGLASEGSFGPHPAVPFALVDEELVAWVDTETDHVVIERARAVSTVPPATTIDDGFDLGGLRIVDSFPDQRAIVVLERCDRSRVVVAKGIADVRSLRRAVDDVRALGDGTVIVEPDLRAHACPDRRTVIAAAVDRLARRLSVHCPECDAPGLGTVRERGGLPCALCGLPTTVTAVDVLGCTRCGHEHDEPRTGTADPTHCDRCNP